jgi:GNAT superfamily N-acetyltransferase
MLIKIARGQNMDGTMRIAVREVNGRESTPRDGGGMQQPRGGGRAPSAETGAMVEPVAIEIAAVDAGQGLPPWTSREAVTCFLHEHLKPFEDTERDIRRGLDDALSTRPGPGGFVVLARAAGELSGALVMRRTGMKGYVPENLLLFVAVAGRRRRQGIGARLIQAAIERCEGDVKLHVEYDNPARRLYERIGFDSKYAEMRFTKGGHQ